MFHIGINFVGPIYPPSKAGNRYILTALDYFTRFGWAKALPTKEAKNVVTALKEVHNNKLYIIILYETAYHPQANGLDESNERFNQTQKCHYEIFSRVQR